MVYALIQEHPDRGISWWHVGPSRCGKWVNDFRKAFPYKSERAVHIAWTAVSKRFNFVKCVPFGATPEIPS